MPADKIFESVWTCMCILICLIFKINCDCPNTLIPQKFSILSPMCFILRAIHFSEMSFIVNAFITLSCNLQYNTKKDKWGGKIYSFLRFRCRYFLLSLYLYLLLGTNGTMALFCKKKNLVMFSLFCSFVSFVYNL